MSAKPKAMNGQLDMVPVMRIAAPAYQDIHQHITSRPPESGGLLLGPTDCEDVTHFFFDAGAACTGATYSPDHVALNERLNKEWRPAGLDWKGFVHAHPRGLDRLSAGDLAYIRRLLMSDDDMDVLLAPIIIPAQFRFVPFVVFRSDPGVPRRAKLVLF